MKFAAVDAKTSFNSPVLITKVKALLLNICGMAVATLVRAEIPWEWPSDPTFEDCAKTLKGSQYSAKYISPQTDFERGTAEIANVGGKVLYHWPAHPMTSFVIRDDRLYCSDYIPYRPDIKIACIDLLTAKVIWNFTLPLDGPRVILQYSNKVNLALRNDKLFVFSQQWWKEGKFSWELSPETGEVLRQSP